MCPFNPRTLNCEGLAGGFGGTGHLAAQSKHEQGGSSVYLILYIYVNYIMN